MKSKKLVNIEGAHTSGELVNNDGALPLGELCNVGELRLTIIFVHSTDPQASEFD